MSGSLNKVMLIGHLGRDPEVRYTGSGTPVANLRIATNERRRSQSGEWEEQTEWHQVVCFGKTAEIAGQYLSKGRQVYIEGRLQTRKWEDKEGQQRYSTEIIANQLTMLGGGSGGSGGGGPRRGGGGPSGAGGDAEEDYGSYGGGPEDDDIPF